MALHVEYRAKLVSISVKLHKKKELISDKEWPKYITAAWISLKQGHRKTCKIKYILLR